MSVKNLDQHGTSSGIRWSVTYKGGRNFLLMVGSLSKDVSVVYDPTLGLDESDSVYIDTEISKMFTELK